MTDVPFDSLHTLSHADRAEAHQNGPAVYGANRDAGTEYLDFHHGPEVPQEVERYGAVLAFTRLADVEPINLYLKNVEEWKEKGFINCYLPSPDGPQTCNVRWKRHDPSEMIKLYDRPVYTRYFVLMIGRFPTYWFRGWARHRELIRAENVTRRSDAQVYVLRQHQLHPSLTLEQLLQA